MSIARKSPHDLGLQWVGILELIDQDARKAARESLAHRLVALEKIARVMEQIVEIEQRGFALVITVEIFKGIELDDESLERQCA